MRTTLKKISVSTWIPKPMAEELLSYVAEGKYVNQADFIRQAIRNQLETEKQ